MYGIKFLERNRHAPKTKLVGEECTGKRDGTGAFVIHLVKLYHVLFFHQNILLKLQRCPIQSIIDQVLLSLCRNQANSHSDQTSTSHPPPSIRFHRKQGLCYSQRSSLGPYSLTCGSALIPYIIQLCIYKQKCPQYLPTLLPASPQL